MVENGTKFWIALRLGNAMNACHTNIALGAVFNRRLKCGNGGAKVESMYANAENINARRR
jgi:hypothetical protein